MYTNKTKVRDLDVIQSPEQRKHIIEKHLLKQSLIIKGDMEKETVVIQKYIDEGEKILVELSGEKGLPENGEIVLYRILAKYVQLECGFLKTIHPKLVELSVNKISIAKSNRAFPRYAVAEDSAHVTNINSSKTVIDASLFNIPTLVKVSFEDYKTKLKTDQLGLIEIDVFKSDQDEKFELVKRTKKFIHIENTSLQESYKSKNENQIDIEDQIHEEIPSMMRKYKDEKIVSEIIYPIVYINHSRQSIPLGYIWVKNKEKTLGADTIEKLSELSKEMVARIKESNTVLTTEKFPIMDISNNGISIKITEPHLIQTLPKHTGFVFDIYIRMQGYFKVFGAIRWVSYDEIGNLLLGLELVGKSSFPGEREKFHKNVELLGQGKFTGLKTHAI
ncbi:DUF1577 domain-containing protein [Leptospira kmetyi]|uniref:DUF1577 domain-containing protein n=2 Tax=Leptospira kmetyi TaxID=408139 RepID=A0A2M9XN03_9LEPT|nr:DUF1577 domain-containing protein [Leptospira kmetyi]AYV55287.1 DUF1577 domain-containing protein [Leptospira kmetyi]EQA52466.1 PF07614 family protein [Leptospira kmetyi serovar Malaysia str. Bejo-Iso9]PJZ30993.1 DUF1577 domain-containing protein [Leptospira kmetyi]PJZ40679.1 DUF1577 domain-containing protein [Leptospira kmetyi]TGK16912.1 DUF1577 domain-containing protein [Leptospira kmetyi]